ncbi:hypothetical protein J1N09_02815 [Aureitalea sp. L0-47]|uniref:hypothetical protein n=1 Tax=Aureitalea sp. L0-47 TaxID=2816962 RepID=UPI00223866AD|nr:hypothetical protein [Aureitalea sp. L0-47]MCW5518754.1 hypothetical protein [Aureitalea sp. L0-47]
MSRNIAALFIIGLFMACNSPSEKNETVSETPEKETSEVKTPEIPEGFVEIDSEEARIATALMAAPEEDRANCTVLGYNDAGEFVTLKEGTNEFICIADDPNKQGFNAACYHKDLEPFMARGRELRKEGKSGGEVFNIREEEAKAGKLDMGKPGSTLHIYFGSQTVYNPETSVVAGAKYRYVVYLPFATSESTGLPEKPIAPNHPWIMNPGTHRAHIMISPINEDPE